MTANSFVRTFLVGLALASLAPAALLAQTPPPKKEAELVAAGNKPLTGQQISALLLGNTTYVTFLTPVGKWQAGALIYAYYKDAKTRVVAPSQAGAFKKYEANWWVDGNKICIEQVVVAQAQSCSSLYEISSALYSCTQDGNCNVMWRVVKGNAEKL